MQIKHSVIKASRNQFGKTHKKWRRVFSSSMTIALMSNMNLLFAQQALAEGTLPGNMNFDLSSTGRTSTAPASLAGRTVNIRSGNSSMQVSSETLLTPAERVAVWQVLSNGTQALQLSGSGTAVGGSFNISPAFSFNISNLVIPQGVTSISNAANLNVLGNLTNSGTLNVQPSMAALATINANNIVNNVGALISAASALNLVAANNIINNGQIIGANSLSFTAGNSIVNANSAGSAISGVISAASNVNLSSANIVNSGAITSTAGNINVSSATPANILFNNAQGTLSALNGDINVRDSAFSGKYNFNMVGGDLFSNNVNVYSGNGNADLDVNDVSGRINVTAANIHVFTKASNLRLGDMTFTEDPTYFNALGSIVVDGAITGGAAAGGVAILAKGDVTSTSAGSINTQVGGTTGFPVTVIAGGNFAINPISATGSGSVSSQLPGGDTTTVFTLLGPSTSGGKIDLSQLSTFSTAGAFGFNGGNVTLAAFGGTGASSGTVTTGNISTGGGFNNASNGNVTIIAGAKADPSGAAVITTGNITTDTTGAGLGGIVMVTGQPVVSGGSFQILNGVVQGGSATASLGSDSVNSGASIATGALTTNAAPIFLVAGKNVTLNGSLSANGVPSSGLTGPGGIISVFAGGNISAAGAISLSSSGGSSSNNAGGEIVLLAGANTLATVTHTFTNSGLNDEVVVNATVSGASATGGNLSMPLATGINSTAGTAGPNGGAAGGNISIAAFAGSSAGSGQVNLPVATISSGGAPITGASSQVTTSNVNGNVTVLAGGQGTAPVPTTITLSQINTVGGNEGGGSVTLQTSAPTAGLPFTYGFDSTAVTNPVTSTGSISPASKLLSANISVANSITAEGGTFAVAPGSTIATTNVVIRSGNNLTLNSISNTNNTLPVAGVPTLSSSTIVLEAAGVMTLNGDISSDAGTAGISFVGDTNSNTTISNINDTTGLMVNKIITGPGIPANTAITALTPNEAFEGSTTNANTVIVISNVAQQQLAATPGLIGGAVTGTNIPASTTLSSTSPQVMFIGTTNDTNTITMSNTSGLAAGQFVTGPGVPAGTFITTVNAGVSIVLNNATTGGGVTNLQFAQLPSITISNNASGTGNVSLNMPGTATIGTAATSTTSSASLTNLSVFGADGGSIAMKAASYSMSSQVTVSANGTGGFLPALQVPYYFQGTLNNGSPVVNVTSTAVLQPLVVGTPVDTVPTGGGIPANTTIAGTFPSPCCTFNLSQNATAGGLMNLVNLAPQDSGGGNGGNISIVSTSSSSGTLTVGTSNFQISALGDTNGGNGGTVSLKSASNIVLDPTQLTAQPSLNPMSPTGFGTLLPSGRGAIINLNAASTLAISSTLDVSGAGSTLNSGTPASGTPGGSGGIINITVNSSTPFNIGGAAAGANGVQTGGILSANGNIIAGGADTAAFGDAGSISVTNLGTGGVVVANTNSSAPATFTGGVTAGSNVITVTSTTGMSVGDVIIGPGILPGAMITSIVPNTSISLSYNATTSSSATLQDCGIAAIQLQAAPATGAPLGTLSQTYQGGTGGQLFLKGNTVLSNGPLDVSGGAFSAVRGSGDGGSIEIVTTSSTAFIVNPSTTNGSATNPLVTTNGVIGTITANGTAGTALATTGAVLSLDATGSGGTIKLSNSSGAITLAAGFPSGGVLAVNALNANLNLGTPGGDGGSIILNANGAIQAFSGLSVNAGTDKQTSITSSAFVNAGSNVVITLPSTTGLYVGQVISITDGTSEESISIQSINPGVSITVWDVVNNYTTTNPTVQAYFPAGNGGTISLTSNVAGTTPFTINPTTALTSNSVNGTLSANGFSGGNISITNNGASGILVAQAGSITTTASMLPSISTKLLGFGGYGGNITISAPKGPVGVIGSLSVNGTTGANSGLNDPNVGGNGGNIFITSNSTTQFVVGAAGPTIVNGIVGNLNSVGGNGPGGDGDAGSISIVSLGSKGILVNTGSLNLTPGSGGGGSPGNGGALSLVAPSGPVFVNDNINVSGDTNHTSPFADGLGGSVTIVSNSSTAAFNVSAGATVNGVNGTISTNGWSGGSITITNLGNKGISIGSGAISQTANIANASVNPPNNFGGTGGSITLNAPTGPVNISGGLDVSGGAPDLTNSLQGGAGGQIAILTGSTTAFNVGGATTTAPNGSTGPLVATGYPGGVVNITANNGGDIIVSASPTGVSTINVTGTADLGAVTFTGDTNNGSAVVTTTDTSGLAVGLVVTGPGIPDNSVIFSINPNVSVTLGQNATATNTGSSLQQLGVPGGNGGTISLQALGTGGLVYVAGNTTTFTGTLNNTATIAVTNTSGLSIGTTVTGTGIPSGTTITGITTNKSITISTTTTTSGSVQLTQVGAGGLTANGGANGTGTFAGNGGSITIVTNNTSPFVLGNAAQGTNGVGSSVLMANGYNAGSIGVKNLGTGGINLNPSFITVSAAQGANAGAADLPAGNGGIIDLQAPAGAITTTATGTLSADSTIVAAQLGSNGGTISMLATKINTSNFQLSLSAIGSNQSGQFGIGGTVLLTQTGTTTSTPALVVGRNQSLQINVNGSPGANLGGSIYITSPAGISVAGKLASDSGSSGTIQLSTTQTSKQPITQTGSTIQTGKLIVVTGSGGSGTTGLTTTAAELAVISNAGSVNISNTGDLSLLNTTLSGSSTGILNIGVTGGSITIPASSTVSSSNNLSLSASGGASSGNITIDGNVIGKIVVLDAVGDGNSGGSIGGTGQVTANTKLTLAPDFAGIPSLTTSTGQMVVNATNSTNISIVNKGDVLISLGTSSGVGAFSLLNSGSILTTGAMSGANNLTLSNQPAAGSNASITLGGVVGAGTATSSVTLNAAGSIVQLSSSNVVSANTINLSSLSGNVGLLTRSITLNGASQIYNPTGSALLVDLVPNSGTAGTLSVSTNTGTANVTVTNSTSNPGGMADVSLTAGGDVLITTNLSNPAAQLNVNTPSSSLNGAITLLNTNTTSGVIQVNADISALGGPLVIQNNNPNSGGIVVADGVTLAGSAWFLNGLSTGNVVNSQAAVALITNGAFPATPVAGSIPGGTTVNGLAFAGNLNNTSTVAVSNTAGLAIGTVVTGAGIPANTTIVSIIPNTSITLSNAATNTASSVPLTATGTVFYGNNTATVNATLDINATGGNVAFQGTSGTVFLGVSGTVTINASSSILVLSTFDLTNSTNVSNLNTLSGVAGSGITTTNLTTSGGTLTIDPTLAGTPISLSNMTAMEIPAGTTVNFNNFNSLNPIAVNVNSTLAAANATINGDLNFKGLTGGQANSFSTDANLFFNSTAVGQIVTTSSAASFASDGNLAINAGGSLTLSGTFSAGNSGTLAIYSGQALLPIAKYAASSAPGGTVTLTSAVLSAGTAGGNGELYVTASNIKASGNTSLTAGDVEMSIGGSNFVLVGTTPTKISSSQITGITNVNAGTLLLAAGTGGTIKIAGSASNNVANLILGVEQSPVTFSQTGAFSVAGNALDAVTLSSTGSAGGISTSSDLSCGKCSFTAASFTNFNKIAVTEPFGTVSITSPTGLGTSISGYNPATDTTGLIQANNGLTISSTKQITINGGMYQTKAGTLSVKTTGASTITLDAVIMEAGLLNNPPLGPNTLPTDIAAKGSINVNSKGDITVQNVSNFHSIGDAIILNASKNISVQGNFLADGGLINITSTGGTLTGSSSTFVANAQGTAATNSLGGQITMTSGPTGLIPTLAVAYPGQLPAAPLLPQANFGIPQPLGSNVSITNTGTVPFGNYPTGAIFQNSVSGSVVDLGNSPSANSQIILNGGFMFFNSGSATSKIIFDNSIFNVSAFSPMAYTTKQKAGLEIGMDDNSAEMPEQRMANIFLPGHKKAHVLTSKGIVESGAGAATATQKAPVEFSMHSGSMFLNPLSDTTIHTDIADVKVKKGALLGISVEANGLRVTAASGPNQTTVVAGGKSISLSAGEEIMISERQLSEEERSKADGIGRRKFSTQKLAANLHAGLCEVSLFGVVANWKQFSAKNSDPEARAIAGRLLKTAAVLSMVTQRHGAYQARPLAHESDSTPSFTPVHYASRTRLRASAQ